MIECACPNCGGAFSYAPADAGQQADCPLCACPLTLPVPSAVLAAPPVQRPQAKRKQVEEFAGGGCFLQGLGVLLWILALASIALGPVAMLLLPMFGIGGVMCIAHGGEKARYYSCGACGSKLASVEVAVCPGCGAAFS